VRRFSRSGAVTGIPPWNLRLIRDVYPENSFTEDINA
jgi:hypothetical protein